MKRSEFLLESELNSVARGVPRDCARIAALQSAHVLERTGRTWDPERTVVREVRPSRGAAWYLDGKESLSKAEACRATEILNGFEEARQAAKRFVAIGQPPGPYRDARDTLGRFFQIERPE